MAKNDRTAKVTLKFKDNASKGIKGVNTTMGKLVGVMTAGNLAAAGLTKVLGAMTAGIKMFGVDAARVAARIQVLNRVFLMTGQNAGYTTDQLKDTKQSIMDLGIAEQQALQIGQRFIQAQLDIGDATKVARAAQDLAVISGDNSSDTALRLTDAIVKQRPILLKQYGIIADLNDIYGAQAEQLGKTVDQLDKTEKRQAFLNEILRQAQTVAGSYEAAMLDVGKRITSLPRHLQAAQNAIGKHFLPAMGAAVDGVTDFLKGVKDVAEVLDTSLSTAIKRAAKNIKAFEKTKETATNLTAEYHALQIQADTLGTGQERLREVTQLLAKAIPEAVEEWNKYGEAVSVSDDKIQEFLKRQEAGLQAGKLSATRQLVTDYEDLAKVDPQHLADEMTRLTNETARLAALPPDERLKYVSEQKTIDLLKVARAELADNTTQLSTYNGQMDRLKAVGAILYPKLLLGSQEYKDAQVLLKPELAEILRLHGELLRVEEERSTSEQDQGPSKIQKEITAAQKKDDKIWEIENDGRNRRVRLYGDEEDIEQQLAQETYNLEVKLGKQGVKNQKYNIDARHQLTQNYMTFVMKTIANEAEVRRRKTQELMQAIGGILDRGMDNMLEEMFTGRREMAKVFKGMAEDFIKYFIKQALIALVLQFIPGMKGILGSIFDTPSNDRMAMTQGKHFTQFFTQGALQEMRSFPVALAGAAGGVGSAGLVPTSPQQAGPAQGGNTFVFQGPITDRAYVADVIMPELEQLSAYGRSRMTVTDNNLTGFDDGFSI